MTDSEESEDTPAAENGRELSDDELDPVTGGARIPDVCKTPTPGGPVPIPYPNAGTKN